MTREKKPRINFQLEILGGSEPKTVDCEAIFNMVTPFRARSAQPVKITSGETCYIDGVQVALGNLYTIPNTEFIEFTVKKA